LPQYQGEYVLRARMAQLANVEARFGWIAEEIRQHDARVEITIAEEGSGAREILQADYAVGCDGGHSITREQIGIERGGADFNQLMVLALFRSRELHEKLERFPPRSTYRVIQPGSRRVLAILWARRRRRELVLSSSGSGEHHAGELRLSRPAAEGGRFLVRLRVRLRRLLGFAHRGRRDLPGPAAFLSRATRRTRIRLTAPTASITGLMTSSISDGRSQ